MIDVTCTVCGITHKAQRPTAKYCSLRCKEKSRHKRRYVKSSGKPVLPPRCCKTCSKTYTPKPGGYNSLYCSRYCQTQLSPQPYDSKGRKRSYQRVKNNPEAYALHLKSGAKGRRLIQEWLSAYKLMRGCSDCGYREYACALQLDHEGEKSIEIADARSSIKRLQEEIDKGKCVVRCANCHAIRTWRQKNERCMGKQEAGREPQTNQGSVEQGQQVRKEAQRKETRAEGKTRSTGVPLLRGRYGHSGEEDTVREGLRGHPTTASPVSPRHLEEHGHGAQVQSHPSA